MNEFWKQLYAYYKLFGAVALRRLVTPPEKWVRDVCKKTGADPEKALEERNEFTEELVEFIESLTDKDFEDPD